MTPDEIAAAEAEAAQDAEVLAWWDARIAEWVLDRETMDCDCE